MRMKMVAGTHVIDKKRNLLEEISLKTYNSSTSENDISVIEPE